MLEVQNFFEKGQAHLIIGVIRGTRSVVLQALETLFFKGLENRVDMRTRQLQAIRDALFVPSFRVHAHHRPPGLIGIGKARKRGQAEFELNGRLIGLKKPFERVMIGLVPEWH